MDVVAEPIYSGTDNVHYATLRFNAAGMHALQVAVTEPGEISAFRWNGAEATVLTQ